MSNRFLTTLAGLALVVAYGLLGIFFGAKFFLTTSQEPGADLVVGNRHLVNQAEPELSRKATFIAVGDIMLSRTVDERMDRYGDAYPFEAVRDSLTRADFAFGNLETPITDGPDVGPSDMVFRADPGVEQELKRENFAVVSLANNHTPNFSETGLVDTFKYLSEAGLAYAGAGPDEEQARQPAIIEQNGLRIAFLAYNDTDVVPDGYAAGPNRPGTVFMDAAAMRADVENVSLVADIVIVSMHSGTEYVFAPNARQTSFARAAIDAGADLVIGHHPHVVQTVEQYNGKYILYSLGNFIFDQMWSQPTREGLMARIDLNALGVSQIEFMPVVIDDYAQPRPADEAEAGPILERLGVSLDAVRFIRIEQGI